MQCQRRMHRNDGCGQDVTATFTLNSYALTTATAGTGSGSVSLNPPGGDIHHGAVVTVTATPDRLYLHRLERHVYGQQLRAALAWMQPRRS